MRPKGTFIWFWKSFYWTYVLFLYVCVVWSPYTKRNITNLEQIERRATRIIFGEEYTEYERLSKLNLLPLQLIHDWVFSI